jgi:glycosyltransferase involved in cell wall biosynthesis
MACNCPIVSVDVGDVKEILGNTEGCFITSYDPADVAEKINMALDFEGRTKGRKKIGHLESSIIAGKVMEVYKEKDRPHWRSIGDYLRSGPDQAVGPTDPSGSRTFFQRGS